MEERINKYKEMRLTFVKPMPGFEGLKEFSLSPLEENDDFFLLKSMEEDLGLVVVSPFIFKNDYHFTLKDEITDRLAIESWEEVMVLSVVTLNSDFKRVTLNLRAPVIINIKSGASMQVILDNDTYKIKHPLIEE